MIINNCVKSANEILSPLLKYLDSITQDYYDCDITVFQEDLVHGFTVSIISFSKKITLPYKEIITISFGQEYINSYDIYVYYNDKKKIFATVPHAYNYIFNKIKIALMKNDIAPKNKQKIKKRTTKCAGRR